MRCSASKDGVHDMTKSRTCACGYTITIPRFGFSLDIHDNQTKQEVSEGFMSDHASVIASALERAAKRLRETATPAAKQKAGKAQR